MATLNNFGIPGVGAGMLQPKLRNRWAATFAGLGGGASSQPLSLQVVTATRPSLSFEEVELHRYNSRSWVAGKHLWEPMTMTLEDDVANGATKVVRNQVTKQQYLIGSEGQWLATAPEGSLYKFVTNLKMLDGNVQILETWVIEGCWLQTVDYTEVDYSASEAVQINLTIRFDHAYQVLNKYSSGQGQAN